MDLLHWIYSKLMKRHSHKRLELYKYNFFYVYYNDKLGDSQQSDKYAAVYCWSVSILYLYCDLIVKFCFLQKSNIQQLKEEIREKLPVVPNTGTLRHSHKKTRPAPPPPMSTNGSGGNSDLEIRAPSELLVGVPATLTTQWRHRPHVLVAGSVNYVASVSIL